jgi:hypothetical protein
MTTASDLTGKTLEQYEGQFADELMQKAIRDRDASAAISRAHELLVGLPAPSQSLLLLEASGGRPLTDDERLASRLRRLVRSLEMFVNFNSTVSAALHDVGASVPRLR